MVAPSIYPIPTPSVRLISFNILLALCLQCVCRPNSFARQPIIFAKHFVPNFQKELPLTCPLPPSKDPDEDADNGDGDEGAPPHTVGQPADLL